MLAGAGSGKTRVLTTRVVHLIREHGVSPARILAVTFTNKAAEEMRERVHQALGRGPSGLWLGTFHSIGARLLRRHAELLGWGNTFTIFDAEQSLQSIKKTQESLGIDPKRWNPTAVRSEVSGAKNQLVSPQRFLDEHGEALDLFVRNVARVYPAYQMSLRDQNAFDFDDLLVKPVELFTAYPDVLERYQNRFSFVLIDEYQDTNHAQFRLIELLAKLHGNLMVVGDDDQSIYRFRGADIRNILEFERTFPSARVVRLEQNYRSTSVILDAANAVISGNLHRKGKTLRTVREAGEKITLVEAFDETDEAGWITGEVRARHEDGPAACGYRDFSVLYRTNAQARVLEEGFRRANLPYQVVGGVRFYERREVRDVVAYLRLIANPRDAGAFERAVSFPRRGVGRVTLERLGAFAAAVGVPLLEAAASADRSGDIPAGGVRGLKAFAALVQRFSARAATAQVGTLIPELVGELDLLRVLREEGPEGEDRAENIRELIAGAVDFDAELIKRAGEAKEYDRFSELDLFLQQVALVSDIDQHDSHSDAVALMTLHNAKGLEFPIVFIAGLEDGLLPLSRTYNEPEEMEEERRLFYVGVTRAQDKLFLVRAHHRRRAGEIMYGRLSPFAEAIPASLIERLATERLLSEAATTPSALRRTRLPERAEHDFVQHGEFDTDYDQDAPRLVKGERVVHASFGPGRVVDVSGFGPDTRVTVEFEQAGRKKLLARYANLRKDYY